MAKAKTPAKRVWRETRRKGERVLVDPAGRVYYGTAQEVRDAALMPRRRNALAQGIKLARHMAARFGCTPDERREWVREKRRDAIHLGSFDDHCGGGVRISPALYIQLCAGARLVMGEGEKVDDYFAQLFRGELDALLDVAQSETGRREIPMTRHERAALESLRRGSGA